MRAVSTERWLAIRAFSILLYPELEVLAIYLIVVAVLIFRPAGLFGRTLA